ncbi:hypothetical protein BFV63_09915 [Enterobacter hormaechei subsp. xiangfangensis]|nr:hypothetical protein BFV63_09915 [Enterobacter hormaechei subsp. xiangfangensis]
MGVNGVDSDLSTRTVILKEEIPAASIVFCIDIYQPYIAHKMRVAGVIIYTTRIEIFYISTFVTLIALASLTDKCEVIASIQAQWGQSALIITHILKGGRCIHFKHQIGDIRQVEHARQVKCTGVKQGVPDNQSADFKPVHIAQGYDRT